MPLVVLSARLSPALRDPDLLDIRRAYAEEHQREHLRPSPAAASSSAMGRADL